MRVRVRRWCGRYRVGEIVEGPEAERLAALYPQCIAEVPAEEGAARENTAGAEGAEEPEGSDELGI